MEPDVIPPLVKLLDAVAELASIEGLDSVVNKIEEAVEELAHLAKEHYGIRKTGTEQHTS